MNEAAGQALIVLKLAELPNPRTSYRVAQRDVLLLNVQDPRRVLGGAAMLGDIFSDSLLVGRPAASLLLAYGVRYLRSDNTRACRSRPRLSAGCYSFEKGLTDGIRLTDSIVDGGPHNLESQDHLVLRSLDDAQQPRIDINLHRVLRHVIWPI